MLASPPAILKSGMFLNVPLWVIGAFLGAVFFILLVALLMAYLFSPSDDEEERDERPRRVEEKPKEAPQEVLEDIKRRYGVSPRHSSDTTWGTVFFALLFLAFLLVVGFVLGKYMHEGEPSGKAFVPYVKESMIRPLIARILSFFGK